MFTQVSRKIIRSPVRSAIARASTATRDGVFKQASPKTIWLGDAGAYPVMFGIGWCAFFASAFSLYYMGSSPDVRLWGKSRERLFRGEIAAEYTRQ